MSNLIKDYIYIPKNELYLCLLNEIKTLDLNKFVFIFIFNDYKEKTNLFESINLDFNLIKEIIRLIIKNISNLHITINRKQLILILNQLAKKNKNLNILLKQNNKEKLIFIGSIFNIFFKTLKAYYINNKIDEDDKTNISLLKKKQNPNNYHILKLWIVAINQLYYEL